MMFRRRWCRLACAMGRGEKELNQEGIGLLQFNSDWNASRLVDVV